MVPGFIFVAFLIVILYSITHENRRYAATASAIRQIWRGTCRLGCRQSYFSEGGTSGLSGLVVQIPEPNPSNDCICESCPCALVENFLKTLGPATRIYSYFKKTITDAYDRLSRVLECRTSCLRNAQLVHSGSNYDSNDDFILVPKSKLLKPSEPAFEQPKPSASTVPELAKQYGHDLVNKLSELAAKISGSKIYSSDTRSSPSTSETTCSHSKTPISNSSVAAPNAHSAESVDKCCTQSHIRGCQRHNVSEETLKPIPSIVDPTRNCSKCVEKGKTCIGGCPNAELKQRAANRNKK